MLLKVLGIIDILSALIILFNIYNIHWIITNFHATVLIIKGIASVADSVGVIFGMVDIICALFIFFAVTGLWPLKVLLVIILIYKGSLSLI
ncbi:MAG: hypothetical protein NT120_01095 [Candidatus Aenigmarchaeota archaeon]|nr:hypothetical protein [Candidatus Aenigmarchaeota archaeon]